MSKKLKKPSDYAQFYFRITDESKLEIDKRVEKILEAMEIRRSEGDPLPKRNNLLIRALKRGLASIERECGLK